MKVFDGHGDLFSHFTVAGKKGEENIFDKYHLSNFQNGNIGFGVFNVWIDDETVLPLNRAIDILSYGIRELNQSKSLRLVTNYNEYDYSDHTIQVIIGLEGIDYLTDYTQIHMMYQYGVRLVGLTWNHDNIFAASSTCEVDYGLTQEGVKAVKLLNDLGIVIDISHVSDKAAFEILNISNKPVIASHSNVRSICNHPRNLSDELIVEVAKSGGLVGMNSYPLFVSSDNSKKNIEGLVEHIIYIKKLVGVDFIALGFDFMDYLADDSLSTFIEGSPFMTGFKNQGDVMKLFEVLKEKGFSKEEIEKIAYKNMFRVLKEII